VSPSPMRAQQGVVLFIALIILVAMTLAGIALMRSVDSGTVIAGNIAFRQNTMFIADLGVEAARKWLKDQPIADLNADKTGNAYYATWMANIDLLGNDADATTTAFSWNADSVNVTAAPYAPPSGYAVRYVIHRLCNQTGDPTAVEAICINAAGAATSTATSSKGAPSYGAYALAGSISAAYRITVQVIGPRNARSYVQTTIY
jgi:type IV pilus assembly protein PilX